MESPFTKYHPINIWLSRAAGIITVFDKGIIYGDIRGAIGFGKKHRKMLGELKGFFIGEIIHGDPRIEIELYQPDQRELNRMKKRKTSKHLKKRGIKKWQYKKYLKKKPLEKYFK